MTLEGRENSLDIVVETITCTTLRLCKQDELPQAKKIHVLDIKIIA